MLLCLPNGKKNESYGGCPDGFSAAATLDGGNFQPLQVQAPLCEGFLCDVPVQDVAFAGFVLVAFAVGFAVGFVRR